MLPTAIRMPQRLGRYEILGRLAAGGMAEIFLGRVLGPQAFERPVAVKRILPHLAHDRAFVDMFVREAQIAASIHHARVVQVHELASFDGEYILIMEYIEGESLGGLMRRLWLRGEPLDRVLAAYIIAEASAGLHAAHELIDAGGDREVVHRDVSPQNVMVTYAGEVKVLDFGIAKARGSAPTQDGQIKGKCEYMSPEQCRGEQLDRRSDIFSLGILLYELTVGRRLFKRDNAMLVFQAVCDEPIPRPVEVDPGYPEVLEAICLRALARDRRDRYATMQEMRRDLMAAIRQMSGPDGRAGEDEQLAAVMSRLFADRIDEKRVMLRQARAGAAVRLFPAAEADTQVELPEVPRTARGAGLAGTHAPAPARVRSTSRRRAIAGGAAIIAAALGGASLGRGSDATSVYPPAAVAVAPRALPAPPAALPPAVKPAMVSLTVDSIPPAAEVFVGGRLRGRTPCSFTLTRADDEITVAISRDRFHPVAERVVPDADQKLLVHLQPSAAIVDMNQGARPRPKSLTTGGPAVFERFN
jgi:serine/threonine-protein kinase